MTQREEEVRNRLMELGCRRDVIKSGGLLSRLSKEEQDEYERLVQELAALEKARRANG